MGIVKKQKHLMLYRLLLFHLQLPQFQILFQLRILQKLAKVKINHVKSLKTVVKEVVRKKERREYANRRKLLTCVNPQVDHVRKMKTVVLVSLVKKKSLKKKDKKKKICRKCQGINQECSKNVDCCSLKCNLKLKKCNTASKNKK